MCVDEIDTKHFAKTLLAISILEDIKYKHLIFILFGSFFTFGIFHCTVAQNLIFRY